uniref:Glycosyltransferase n=1 Tax=Steinernema glaseri TaxID=37863 RepID=A0A1I7Z4K9_9BILA
MLTICITNGHDAVIPLAALRMGYDALCPVDCSLHVVPVVIHQNRMHRHPPGIDWMTVRTRRVWRDMSWFPFISLRRGNIADRIGSMVQSH